MAKKEKMVRLDARYDDLEGMLVPESLLPQGEMWGNGFKVNNGVLVEFKSKKKDVVIPEGIQYLKDDVFQGTLIHSVILPKSLVELNPDSFAYCYSLEKVEVAEGHPKYYVENNCVIDSQTKTLIMGLHSSLIPENENVQIIGEHAFAPNGWGCHNNNIIPKNIVEIKKRGFAGCGLYSISIPPTIKKMGKMAFTCCQCLKKVIIEEGVKKISDEAFSKCDFLNTVVLPNTLETIGKKAFFQCERLTNINIPSSLKSIGMFALCWSNNWYEGIQGKLVIPKNLKINYASFPCYGLESISVEEGNPYYYCENDCLIEKETKTLVLGCKNSIIPNGIKKIDNVAFYFSVGLKNVIIPEGVEEIGEDAFRYSSEITEVIIPKSVTKIGKNAFQLQTYEWHTSPIKSVTMPRCFENQNDIFDKVHNIKFTFLD